MCIQNALRLFVHTKAAICARHQYALVCLADKAEWLLDFTGDVENITDMIGQVTAQEPSPTFDMASLGDEVLQRVRGTVPKPLSMAQLLDAQVKSGQITQEEADAIIGKSRAAADMGADAATPAPTPQQNPDCVTRLVFV